MADPNTEEAGPDSEESTQESMHTSTPFASQQAADSGLSLAPCRSIQRSER